MILSSVQHVARGLRAGTRRVPALLGLCLCVGIAGCGRDEAAAEPAAASEVGVVVLDTSTYTVRQSLPGRTRATIQAEVRPQIQGIIEKRTFIEGATVAAGDLLYKIESSPYEAALEQAQAELAQARASLQSDAPLAARYKELAEIDAISKQERDNAQATLAQDKADIATAQAAVRTARINLDFTEIRAPIDGQIGPSRVTPGALVTTNQTDPLTTITQLDPMFVDIQQSAAGYLRLKQAVDSGALAVDDNQAAPVRVSPEGADLTARGRLQFTGVTVDANTGSVTLRAIVDNPDRDLLPGMYVEASLVQGIDTRALLVPQQGIDRSSAGQPTALVVEPGGTVAKRRVTIAGATDDNRWRITDGLAAGDRLIVQGRDKVEPGDTPAVTPLVMQDGRLMPAADGDGDPPDEAP